MIHFWRKRRERSEECLAEDIACSGMDDDAAAEAASTTSPENEWEIQTPQITTALSSQFSWTSLAPEADDIAELIQCEPLNGAKLLFKPRRRSLRVYLSHDLLTTRRRWRVRTGRSAQRIASSFATVGAAIWGVLLLPVRLARWTLAIPGRLVRGFVNLPWAEMLMVRKGFIVGLFAGLSVAGTGLWALSSLPSLPGHPVVPIDALEPIVHINARTTAVPSELAWFFIQFPYISDKATYKAKNRHTYVVTDEVRHRDYVVVLGQRFRRIEVYDERDRSRSQVIILTPGAKETVTFNGRRVAGRSTVPDGNLWMWRTPLWNAMHLKIYGMADVWLDAPYKRFSCAGFVHRFLLDAGVHVPVLDAWDMAKLPWTRVSMAEMEPGDIITIRAATRAHRRFWHHAVTHVGVYIGHGKMIHASTASRHSSRSWVRVSDVSEFHGRIDKILRPPELL